MERMEITRSNQFVILAVILLLSVTILGLQYGAIPKEWSIPVFAPVGLAVLAVLTLLLSGAFTKLNNRKMNWIRAQEQHSPYPVILTDGSGQVVFGNVAAEELAQSELIADSIIKMLDEILADPRPVVFRLQERLKLERAELEAGGHTRQEEEQRKKEEMEAKLFWVGGVTPPGNSQSTLSAVLLCE